MDNQIDTSFEKINFKDQNFQNALVTELKKQHLPLTEEGASKLLTLNISAKNIVNLEGIEICRNLRFLAASQNKIQSIQPLQALENLVTVSIWENAISDLSSLELNYKLQKIYAFDNPLQIFPSKQLINLMGKVDFTGIKTTDSSETYFDADQSLEQRQFDGISWENIKKKNNEKQAAEVERQRIEAEQAAEAERQRIEAEQAAEVERQRIEAEQAAEAERQRIEAEQAAEVERQRIEAERQRIEAEQAAEAERQRIEAEQAAEVERQRIEAEQAAEVERQRTLETSSTAAIRDDKQPVSQTHYHQSMVKKYESVEQIQSENILTFDMIEHFAPQGPTKQFVIDNEPASEKKVDFRKQISIEKAGEINSLNNSVTSKKSDIMQLAINAETAEKQLVVLRHELLTTEVLELLLNNKPETYILKLIFANSKADAAIKQKILQLENPQQIFNLYARHTLKKEVETAADSWTLEQYAKIAFDSESQLAVLNNSQVNSICIQSILAINPEIYILKIIATHEKTPEAERTKVLENLQLEKSEVLQHVQNDEQFFKLISDVNTSDQLEKYAFLATTPEMQLAILRHPKVSTVTLEIMSDLVTELPILKLILIHVQTNNQIIEKIIKKLPDLECEKIFRMLSGSEFEKFVVLVNSSEELAFFTRFANTAIKQLSVVRNKYIDQKNLEILKELNPEPYIKQQLDKLSFVLFDESLVERNIETFIENKEYELTLPQKIQKIQLAKTSAELKPFLGENNLTLNILIAKHLSADAEILKKLIDLQDAQITTYVRKNRNMTANLRKYLYQLEQEMHNENYVVNEIPKKTEKQEVLKTIDYHQKIRLACSSDIESQGYFADLAHESRNEVRQALIDNPLTPREIIVYLTKDRIQSISENAKKRLQNFKEEIVQNSRLASEKSIEIDYQKQIIKEPQEVDYVFNDLSGDIDLIDINQL